MTDLGAESTYEFAIGPLTYEVHGTPEAIRALQRERQHNQKIVENALAKAAQSAKQATLATSDWAPTRIWLQRGFADGGGHTWCEDSQPEHEQAEYVRVGLSKPLDDEG